MMFLKLRKLENICCGHKMFLNKIRNIFLCAGHKICVCNKCCGRTGKHLCPQQCVLVCQDLYDFRSLRSDWLKIVVQLGSTEENTLLFSLPSRRRSKTKREQALTMRNVLSLVII